MELSNTKEERRRAKEFHRSMKAQGATVDPIINPTSSEIYTGETITILCVRFGTKYGREYVERLRDMVARHITVPYTFVCLTDDRHPIDGVVSIVQPMANYKKLWWHKVHMFDPDLPLQGRILYFDLDIVIHNNINKLFVNQEDKFLGIRDFNRKFIKTWFSLNSSVMTWVHGTQSNVYISFKERPQEAQTLQGDQDWIWKICRANITFWPDEWIMSYKWEIRSRDELIFQNGKRQFKTVASPPIPSQCSVLVFHGDPKPEDVQDQFIVDNWR
jgi:hypothetical protein